VGFLPFNTNPAKIIMGDTGALFLGYTLSVLSIEGLFKVHAVMSFIIPFSIFGLPLFDTALAIIRRLLHGKSPFSADRGHLHHKLVDMGFGHKQTVRILYAISGVLGIAAVMLTDESLFSPGIIIAAAFVIYIIDFILIKNAKNRALTGLTNIDAPEEIDSAEESIFLNEKDAQNQNGKNGNENLKEKTSESSSGE